MRNNYKHSNKTVTITINKLIHINLKNYNIKKITNSDVLSFQYIIQKIAEDMIYKSITLSIIDASSSRS